MLHEGPDPKKLVEQLQQMLLELDYDMGQPGINGDFGAITKTAVTTFQENSKDWDGSPLQVDGVVGPKTADAINRSLVGKWYDPYSTPKELMNGSLNICLSEELFRSGISVEVKDVKKLRFLIAKPPPFHDLKWVEEEDGTIALNARTTFPDGTRAKFTVYKLEGRIPKPQPNSVTTNRRPNLGPELGKADAVVSGGQAGAEWVPPQGYDPFALDSWLTPRDFEWGALPESDDELERIFDFERSWLNPPIFCVEAEDHWAFSRPPGQSPSNLEIADDSEVAGIALSTDGTFISFRASGGKLGLMGNKDIVFLVVDGKKVIMDEGGSAHA